MKIERDTASVNVATLTEIGVDLKRDVTLAPFTTAKIGGPADFFVAVTSLDQLLNTVGWARSVELPYFLLGGGSNMLISDAGIRGLVIYNRCRQVAFQTDVELAAMGRPGHVAYDAVVHAESGAAMAGIARQAVNRGYEGLEWAVSLPGTVGGAVVGNAGAYGGEVKDCLMQASIASETGDVADVDVSELAYGYRSSALKRQGPLTAGLGTVVLAARFGLKIGDPDSLRQLASEFLAHRRSTQPVEPSLGSTFVNPPGDYAGRLIEAAGLKGAAVGGVQVSQTHANFLINPGGAGSARASDVVKLVELIREKVRNEFGVDLEPEIQIAGTW